MNNGGFSIEHLLREAQGYSSPPVLRSHVSSLKRIFPTLNPTVAEFMFNDGTQANLIKLSGTIPIFFRKNRYNIPVCIWLPKTYPASPPIAYVEALQDMFIKPGHPFVDPSGYVRVPVINTWNPQRSTLIMLCEEMSAKFSQESPIYKRAPQGANSSPRTNQHSATRPPAYEPNQNIISSRTSQRNIEDKPFDVRDAMAAALSEKVQRVLNQKFDDIKHSSNELLLKQSRLKDGTENITGSISCLKNDISSIKSCIEAIKKSNTETEFWIEINQGKDINNLSADELIMPRDTWSKQLIENAAMDHAIEDTFYELDDALNKGLINLEEFLKHTRRLGREQFFARALAMKIHEKQQSEN